MSDKSSGFIKLYRSLVDWEWYDDANTLRLWIHLLLSVNHEDKKWHGVEIKRGQKLTSVRRLALELHLTDKEVRTALDHLKSTGEIRTERANERANGGTLVTVEKYADFQTNPKKRANETANETANEGRTKGERGASNKNDKNYKNEKNILPRKRGRKLSFAEELDAIIEGSDEE